MKKLLLLVSAVIVIAGAGSLVVSKNKNYQNKQAQATAAAEQHQVDNAVSAATAVKNQKITELQGEKASLQSECQKGLAAYAQVAPAIRAKLPQPVCTVSE